MCEQRERVLDYLYDEASPASRRDIERHLDACDECRQALRAFQNVREDLLAWSVPNPPSRWTAFAPVPVVPWHRQVPAWALAAAASVMLLMGSAGGFLAHGVLERRGSGAGDAPAAVAVPQASQVDPEAVMALIRQELANARKDTAGHITQVSATAARPFRMDATTEARLLARVTDLVNTSQQRQLSLVGDYLYKVAQENERQRRDDGRRLTGLTAQVEQLQAAVSQLVLAQAKGQ